MKTVEIEIARFEVHALYHAATTLRWVAGKTEHGWSHPAVDAERCAVDADRFEELYYAARSKFRPGLVDVATFEVAPQEVDLLQRFIATVTAAEGTEFGDTMTTMARLAHRITTHGQAFEPPSRRRPSVLTEGSRQERQR